MSYSTLLAKAPLESFDESSVSLYGSLLGIDSPNLLKAAPAIAKTKGPSRKTQSTTTAPVRKNKKDGTQFIIHEPDLPTLPALEGKERKDFATHLFNRTISLLTTAAKTKQAKQASCADKASQTLLKESGPNRATGKDGAKQDTTAPAYKYAVWCTELALSCLRSHVGERSSEIANAGLDSGMLALLDKAITLELRHEADRLSRSICEQYWTHTGITRTCTDLASCMNLPWEPSSTRFNFLTSIQSQLLRIAILQGSSCLNNDFIHLLDAKTVGSPAWTILQGHEHGFLSSEACGSQLRTVSLALSRLHAVSEKAVDLVAVSLRLASTALQIKCISWQYLGHQPDFTREIWTPFSKLIQKSVHTSKKPSIIKVDAGGSLKDLSLCLAELGFPSRIPATLRSYCGLNDEVDDSPTGRPKKPSVEDESGQQCLKALSICMQAMPTWQDQSQGATAALDAAVESLAKLTLSSEINDSILVEMARLRKSIMPVMKQIMLMTPKQSDEHYSPLYLSSARTLFGILKVNHQLSRSTGTSKSSSQNNKQLASRLLTYAKTIEDILEVERHSITRSAALEEEMHSALMVCLAFGVSTREHLKLVEISSHLQDFYSKLAARVSTIFWNRFMLYTQQARLPSFRAEVLLHSIRAVDNISHEQRPAASIVLKHERLAALYIEQKMYSKAQASLTTSIQLCIENKTLENAVNASLQSACGHLWYDRGASGHMIGLCLNSYVELTIKHNIPNNRGTWYFDDPLLEDIQRAALMERQLLHAIEHGLSLSTEQYTALIRLWEELCSKTCYRVHQMRIISRLIYSLEKHEVAGKSDLLRSLSVARNPGVDFAKDTHLRASGPILHHLIVAQWSLSTKEVSESLLVSHVSDLCSTIEQLASHKSLKSVIPELSITQATLKSMADYAGVLGLSQLQLRARQSLLLLQQHCNDAEAQQCIPDRLAVIAVHLELDQTVEAGRLLASVETVLNAGDPDDLQWKFLYAEYSFSIGDTRKAVEVLTSCGKHFANLDFTQTTAKLDSRITLCRAVCLASRLAWDAGNLAEATNYARQATKLSSGIWESVERVVTIAKRPSLTANDSTLGNITHDMSNLALVDEPPCPTLDRRGVKFWEPLSLHRKVLRYAAKLAGHNGLYQDALFFAQQAAKVTRRTGGTQLRIEVESELALILASAAEHDTARRLLQDVSLGNSQDLQVATMILNQAEAFMHLGETASAAGVLKAIEETLSPASACTRPAKVAAQQPVAAQKGRGNKAVIKKPAQAKVAPQTVLITDSSARTFMSKRAKEIKSRAAALGNVLLSATEEHDSAHRSPASLSPLELLSHGVLFIRQALKQFAADPSSNAIAETALALPVRYRHGRKSGQLSLLSAASPARSRRSCTASQAGCDTLLRAYDWLSVIDAGSLSILPTAKVDELHKALCQVVLLSTAASKPLSLSPLGVVMQSLHPKDVAYCRQRYAIQAETATATMVQLQKWPTTIRSVASEENIDDLVQSLPLSWKIVSVGLSYDHKELLLSSLMNGKSPFMMRVPLARPSMDDDEPCEFTLQSAKDELLDIISRANETAHDSRGQGDRGARNAWYAERQHLDKRLELLLANIENIWLGGFRALFSPERPDQDLLARFAESLKLSLDKHLPSRQKKSRTKSRVELHAHVLELFTSIPFEEDSADFEDSITDLLYFMADIFQFNGEPNAFDEIDFDALLLEVTDALRGYHTTRTIVPRLHTILVIDKELQPFPWESLPCLRGNPVSRMPSLSAIQARLPKDPDSDFYNVARQGSYILNPSNDLINTQATLSPLLSQHLPDFQHLINQAPTEPHFQSFLTTSPILLYFGHGAGTQYIRGRTIRRMEKCAVTWLMGCSSVKLTECGVYDSYGVPWHYMHGGSPAVVGTLWDVTDRDIDRFAVKGLGEWGLLDADGIDEKFWGRSKKDKISGKGKGKAKAESCEDKRGGGVKEKKKKPLSLDQAVANARDVCLLRYLNGAAPVVYGVPVMLE